MRKAVLELTLRQWEGKEVELVLPQRSHHWRRQHSRPQPHKIRSGGKAVELVLQQMSHHRHRQHSRPYKIRRMRKEFPHMSLKGGKTFVAMNFIWRHLDCSSENFQLPDHRDHLHMCLRGLPAPRRESLNFPGQCTRMLMWNQNDANNHGVVSSR